MKPVEYSHRALVPVPDLDPDSQVNLVPAPALDLEKPVLIYHQVLDQAPDQAKDLSEAADNQVSLVPAQERAAEFNQQAARLLVQAMSAVPVTPVDPAMMLPVLVPVSVLAVEVFK